MYWGNLGDRDASLSPLRRLANSGPRPQEPNSDGNNRYDDGVLISLILKTVLENTPCINTFLTSTLKKKLKIPKSEGKRFSDKIRYLIKKLERHGFIITKRISKRLYYVFIAPIFSQSQKEASRGESKEATLTRVESTSFLDKMQLVSRV